MVTPVELGADDARAIAAALVAAAEEIDRIEAKS